MALDNQTAQDALFKACRVGDLAAVRKLLGVASDEENSIWQTVNYWASMIVEWFFPKAEVNVQDRNGLTALHYACYKGHEHIVQLLLAHKGIDVNVRDSNRQTALHQACNGCHEGVVKRLLAHKAIDVNLRDRYGRRPLGVAYHILVTKMRHISSWSVKYNIIRLLLTHERLDVSLYIDSKCIQMEGLLKPLHLASLLGLEEEIYLLVKKGANIDDFNNALHTPATLALKNGSVRALSILLKLGSFAGLYEPKVLNPRLVIDYQFFPNAELVYFHDNEWITTVERFKEVMSAIPFYNALHPLRRLASIPKKIHPEILSMVQAQRVSDYFNSIDKNRCIQIISDSRDSPSTTELKTGVNILRQLYLVNNIEPVLQILMDVVDVPKGDMDKIKQQLKPHLLQLKG